MSKFLDDCIRREKEAAAEAGEFALLYIRKAIGRPKDAGDLARLAARAAVRAMYWEGGQERKDSILFMSQTSHVPPKYELDKYTRQEFDEMERTFFHLRQWEWFNMPDEGKDCPCSEERCDSLHLSSRQRLHRSV